MSAELHDLPPALEQFGHTLVRRLHVLRRRARRRRLIAVCSVACALVAGTAIAATHALEGGSGSASGYDSFLFDPQDFLYGQFRRDVTADIRQQQLLLTLPAHANGYGGSRLYVTHMRGGGDCLRLLVFIACGPSPDARDPIRGLAAPNPSAPSVYAGLEARGVTRHVIRCGTLRRDVTSNAGAHRFVFVVPRGVDGSTCRQTSTLAHGSAVTSTLR